MHGSHPDDANAGGHPHLGMPAPDCHSVPPAAGCLCPTAYYYPRTMATADLTNSASHGPPDRSTTLSSQSNAAGHVPLPCRFRCAAYPPRGCPSRQPCPPLHPRCPPTYGHSPSLDCLPFLQVLSAYQAKPAIWAPTEHLTKPLPTVPMQTVVPPVVDHNSRSFGSVAEALALSLWPFGDAG
ncbi:MAG: hypothetical protein NZ703_08440, partial [Gemmataceae bacterium]|nr:hypothetical protein [Gemmataceae bacterium]